MVHKKYDRNVVEDYVKHALKIIQDDTELNLNIKFNARQLWNNEDLIPSDSNHYFKLISEQPKN